MKAKPEILDGIRKELAYERMSSKEYGEKELQMMIVIMDRPWILSSLKALTSIP